MAHAGTYLDAFIKLVRMAADLRHSGQMPELLNSVILGLLQTNARLTQENEQLAAENEWLGNRWWALRDDLTATEADLAGLEAVLQALLDETWPCPNERVHSLVHDDAARQRIFEQFRDAYEPFSGGC